MTSRATHGGNGGRTAGAPWSNIVTAGGQRVAYDEYGEGDQVVVLLHALLMSRRMQRPLAERLAARGHRVICLDLLGELEDGSRPEPWRYTSERFGAQVIDAFDALGIERAVLGGTSLGSNVTLEAALRDPDRVIGMILEGPFLEHSMYATGLGWSALFALFTVGRPAVRLAAVLAERLPIDGTVVGGVIRDAIVQDPVRSAAFLQGLFFGRMGPPREQRVGIDTPALVIGFSGDPFHALADAYAITNELVHARLVRAPSILDLRLWPGRLADEIAGFTEKCWSKAVVPTPRRSLVARPRSAGGAHV